MPNSQWTDFLRQQGAELNTEGTRVLGSPAESGLELIPLLNQGVLALTGPQAETFLQGQVTCDLKRLSTDQSLLGSNCTPKGNVLSVFRLFKVAEASLLLRMPRAILEPALANLKKYIVFSKAEISDASEEWAGIGLQGEGAASRVQALFDKTPQTAGEQCIHGELLAVRVPGDRFEIWGPVEAMMAQWPSLRDEARLAPSAAWTRSELAAGLVQLDADSVDNYLPHMLNLQAVEGISFEKGCYTGQEVVARMQHRGKLKKHLFRGQVESEAEPAPGTTLHTPERRSVGKVIASVALPEGGHEIQAIINKGEADKGDLRLGEQDGPAVTLRPLPYTIDPELFERPVR